MLLRRKRNPHLEEVREPCWRLVRVVVAGGGEFASRFKVAEVGSEVIPSLPIGAD